VSPFFIDHGGELEGFNKKIHFLVDGIYPGAQGLSKE
jgi:hypothetical protein